MKPNLIQLRRGFDIPLRGEAERVYLDDSPARRFALRPADVCGLAPIPKLEAREGDRVLAGQAVFHDKSRPGVSFCAPISGWVAEVRRGARRAIEEIVMESDGAVSYREFGRLDPDSAPRQRVVERLCEAGAWVLLRQRPYHVVPDPGLIPRDIFVSCFDSAPLAADAGFLMEGQEEAFAAGLRVLRRLTGGKVHLGVRAGAPPLFRDAAGVEVHTFAGPHPAGNVGVQIHHIRPLCRGEAVWTAKPQDVAVIGRLFLDGIFDARRTVAITGAEVARRGYWRTRIGASIESAVEGNLSGGRVRFISGNVLTGKRIAQEGFLGLFDDQVTVVAEGDQPEFLGWLTPSYPRPSLSRTFLSFLRPGRRYRADTSTHGELRAFVMTGEYERVLPMDIYPQYLMKAILVGDFDRMEGLGIHELVEEDVALCEFACTSKQPVQKILRDGLDALRAEEHGGEEGES